MCAHSPRQDIALILNFNKAFISSVKVILQKIFIFMRAYVCPGKRIVFKKRGKMAVNILEIIQDFQKECPCGKKHETAVRDVLIEAGAVQRVGDMLLKNNFCRKILLVADENTLKASEGIAESLSAFSVIYKI